MLWYLWNGFRYGNQLYAISTRICSNLFDVLVSPSHLLLLLLPLSFRLYKTQHLHNILCDGALDRRTGLEDVQHNTIQLSTVLLRSRSLPSYLTSFLYNTCNIRIMFRDVFALHEYSRFTCFLLWRVALPPMDEISRRRHRCRLLVSSYGTLIFMAWRSFVTVSNPFNYRQGSDGTPQYSGASQIGILKAITCNIVDFSL